jgi:hypothetical protein
MNNSGQPINPFQGQPTQYPGVQGGVIPGRTTPGNPKQKKDHSSLVKTILLVFMTILSITFLILFIWMFFQYNEASTDLEGKVELAVAEAENGIRTELEKEFEEKEKYPFKTFAGPVDFGQLTFEYPKTWSVYVPDDASRADDFHAYFNPGQVNVVNDQTIMSLRVSIINTLTDEVKEDYADKVEQGEMTVSTTVVNGVNVDVYTGKLDSDLQGIICIFKIRDKTVLIQTDAMLFSEDFYRVLSTIRFNA